MSLLKIRNLLVLLLVLAFVSCAEDSGPSQSSDTELKEPSLITLYDKVPDMANCYEGVLKQSEKMNVLDQINMYRAIHKLPAVTYNNEFDELVQKASLILTNNDTMTHYPPENLKCWSADGYTGSGKSNLLRNITSVVMNWPSEKSVDGWISEKHTFSGLGHRRWVLSPFLKTVSFGRVDKVTDAGYHWLATSLYVFDSWTQTPADVEFIACPFEDYPIEAFEKDLFLSFAVLADKSTVWGDNKNVDFSSGVTIQVFDESGNMLVIKSQSNNNDGSGLPNHLQWKVLGLENDKRYNVQIGKVKVNGKTESYDYWFRIKP